MKKATVLFSLAFALYSCSIFKTKPLPYPEGVIFPVEKEEELVYEGEIIDSLVRSGENLFFSTRNGSVYCIDGRERRVQWQYKTSETLDSPVYLNEKNIYVFDEENTLYSLSQEGRLRWSKKIAAEITSGIVEYKEKVCFGLIDGNFIALNYDTGDEVWIFKAGDAVKSQPFCGNGMIIFGCDDHYLYFLSENGSLLDKFKADDKIQSPILVDRNSLYFGTNDHNFYCLNLEKRKKKWKVRIGGKVLASPVSDGKRIFFLCWNSVLYCLNKNNGTIYWWKAIPSRSYYSLEVSGSLIVASSLSSQLVAYDIKTGNRRGYHEAGQEVKSNPVWLKPFLVINLYDYQQDSGRLLFLKKVLQVRMTSSKPSPHVPNEEIVFSAQALGFYLPEYEFYLKEGENQTVVQEKSNKSTWSWFPEKGGVYRVGVIVTDEKEEIKYEIPFVINEGN